MLIGVNGLSKSFGDNLLFENIGFEIEPEDKIGLIGGNGCGKTTLFKILSGEEVYDAGSVVRKSGVTVGVLNQHACAGSKKSAYEEALTVFSGLLSLEQQLEEVNTRLETVADNELILLQHQLQEQFERDGGLTFRNRTRSALSGVGLTESEQQLSCSVLSGGQRSKVELCKLLLSQPDVILLDEPTNHLDIDAIEWLDGYIKQCKSAVMIISHDRYFLDSVANKIFELDSHKLYCSNGNYTRYCDVRAQRTESVKRQYDNTMHEVERIERIIEQQRRWNREKNIKTAESKQKMIDRMLKDLEIPDTERENINFSFTTNLRSGDDVLKAENLSVEFDGKVLYKNVGLKVRRGDRIFLIGPNGCGKTTLLKGLLDRSVTEYGVGVSVGYFDQHQRNLDLNKTIFEQLRDDYPRLNDTSIRSALALFLFKGDEVFSKIETLSGGERARVALCRLMLAHNNLLLLDEPTNHLDLTSREVLEDALQDFEGTLICVSHDRYFINRLATKINYFEDKTLKQINGNYEDYVEARKPLAQEVAERPVSMAKNAYINKKAEASRLRKARTAFKKCEEEISRIEVEINETSEQLQAPEISTDYIKATELSQKVEQLNERLALLLEQWEKLALEVEET